MTSTQRHSCIRGLEEDGGDVSCCLCRTGGEGYVHRRISMGGYGALINGLRYSDTFSKIGMPRPRWACIPRTERCSPEARFTGVHAGAAGRS